MEKIPQPAYSEERYKELREKMIVFVESLSDDEAMDVIEKFNERGISLLEKYEDARDYAFFHALIGSSGIDKMLNIKHEDFPGEDSVELFIDNLMNQK